MTTPSAFDRLVLPAPRPTTPPATAGDVAVLLVTVEALRRENELLRRERDDWHRTAHDLQARCDAYAKADVQRDRIARVRAWDEEDA